VAIDEAGLNPMKLALRFGCIDSYALIILATIIIFKSHSY
jgi:hypothetical protein